MKKKPDFGKITKKSLNPPKSMNDFLGSGNKADEKTETKKSKSPRNKTADNNKSTDKKTAKTEEMRLYESITVYTDPEVLDILDSLWVKLRRKAPVGSRKRISKSLIINKMVQYCNEEIEKKGFDSKIIKRIFEA